VRAGNRQNADKQVDDFVRTVAHNHTVLVNAVSLAQRLCQSRIAALRIAEGPGGVAFHSFAGQRGHAQRVFVAGHLDNLGKVVLILDFGNGKAGNIGLEGHNFLAHTDLGHGYSTGIALKGEDSWLRMGTRRFAAFVSMFQPANHRNATACWLKKLESVSFFMALVLAQLPARRQEEPDSPVIRLLPWGARSARACRRS